MRTRETVVTFNREEYWIIDEVDRMANEMNHSRARIIEMLVGKAIENNKATTYANHKAPRL